jgi:hypothetical protein
MHGTTMKMYKAGSYETMIFYQNTLSQSWGNTW